MDYNETHEIIKATHVLDNEDAQFIASSIELIQANWEKRQLWRTETEMRISVLNDTKFPTPASKYWQCVREQAVFYENLIAESWKFRRNEIQIKRIERSLEEEKAKPDPDELTIAELEIDLEEAILKKLDVNAKREWD